MAVSSRVYYTIHIVISTVLVLAVANAMTTTDDCRGAIYEFSDCLESVEDGVSVRWPPREACCNGLGAVVRQGVVCLCEALKEGSRFGVAINMTRARRLPSACGISSPPMGPCVGDPSSPALPMPPPPKSSTAPPSPPESPAMPPTPVSAVPPPPLQTPKIPPPPVSAVPPPPQQAPAISPPSNPSPPPPSQPPKSSPAPGPAPEKPTPAPAPAPEEPALGHPKLSPAPASELGHRSSSSGAQELPSALMVLVITLAVSACSYARFKVTTVFSLAAATSFVVLTSGF